MLPELLQCTQNRVPSRSTSTRNRFSRRMKRARKDPSGSGRRQAFPVPLPVESSLNLLPPTAPSIRYPALLSVSIRANPCPSVCRENPHPRDHPQSAHKKQGRPAEEAPPEFRTSGRVLHTRSLVPLPISQVFCGHLVFEEAVNPGLVGNDHRHECQGNPQHDLQRQRTGRGVVDRHAPSRIKA